MDMFDLAMKDRLGREAPLAARMRPRSLDEFIGQDHIIGPGRLLRRAIKADQLSSLIFFGPPGTGKTTLAMVIANTTRSHFITINAVLAGVKEIREAIGVAQERRGLYNQRTILFVDEVHRFNKAQQDALLPWVENGTVILIGATTENPWFSVNPPLVSRSRIFQLKPLTADDLRQVARQALADEERGYGRLDVDLRTDALEHLVNVSNGDARSLLNALELAVETTPPNAEEAIVVDMAVAEESIQRRAVLYDKEGDYHFDTISAFIKSLRGSDPDATMYWLAKMVYAGEDPRFIFRRMYIFAGEDVGLADPQAISVVNACAQAYEWVGMPEGRFPLAEAALYLATAPKSNSAFAFFDALRVVEQEREGEAPSHLKDANRDQEGFGHGEGYLYPHAYRDHWVTQQYLPASLQGRLFYQPGELGYEAAIRETVLRRREAQLAAAAESESAPAPEILTFSPADRTAERWLQRAMGAMSQQLESIRQRVFSLARVQRHHRVLDLCAGAGLLTWEALRLAPEGGVWSIEGDERNYTMLRDSASRLPELSRPVILHGGIGNLRRLLEENAPDGLHFDIILGRNALGRLEDKAGAAADLSTILSPTGQIVLCENIPRYGQRLYDLVAPEQLGADLLERLRQAEEAVYADREDPMVNWDADGLREAFEGVGFSTEVHQEVESVLRAITPAQVERWFSDQATNGRLSYAARLLANGLISGEEVNRLKALLSSTFSAPTPWKTTYVFLRARFPGQKYR